MVYALRMLNDLTRKKKKKKSYGGPVCRRRKVGYLAVFLCQIKPVDMVLCLECTDETMARSVLRRAETDGRSDDNLETFRKRLRTFHANNAAIVEAYKSKAVSVSVERNPEVVFAEVQKHFDTLVSCSVSTRTWAPKSNPTLRFYDKPSSSRLFQKRQAHQFQKFFGNM